MEASVIVAVVLDETIPLVDDVPCTNVPDISLIVNCTPCVVSSMPEIVPCARDVF